MHEGFPSILKLMVSINQFLLLVFKDSIISMSGFSSFGTAPRQIPLYATMQSGNYKPKHLLVPFRENYLHFKFVWVYNCFSTF